MKKMKGLIFSAATALLLTCPVGAAQAGLSNEMSRMFDNVMTNTTMPGAIEGTRRAGVVGGSLVARTRIMNENLVSVVPFSMNAGCGGIDLYGGSFSFINADQFVEFAKTIAQNAAGYAFYLAMEAMAPSVRTQIDTFQQKVQALNQHFGNSCQLAQGIVNDTARAFGAQIENEASILATTQMAGDVFSVRSTSSGTDAQERTKDDEELRGNIVWEAMNEQSTDSWFNYYPSREMKEAIMSVSGSVIIGEMADSPDGEGRAREITTLAPLMVTLRNLVEGGLVPVYDCSGAEADECLEPGIKVIELKGFAQMFEDTLIGTGSTEGVLTKLAQNSGLSPDESALLANLPNSIGGMLFRLIRLDRGYGEAFAREASRRVGLLMADQLIQDMLRASRLAAGRHQSAYMKEALDQIRETSIALREERRELESNYGTMAGLLEHYGNVMREAEKDPTLMPHVSQPKNATTAN